MIFKVGNSVKANRESNKHYGITSELNKCVGEIIEVNSQVIRIKVTSHIKRKYIGQEYQVCPEYFDLVDGPKNIIFIDGEEIEDEI